MTFVFHAFGRLAGTSVTATFLVAAVVAQAATQESDRANLRRSSSPTIEQQKDWQVTVEKNRVDADKRFNEMDRKLNRTMRSVCVGC